MNKNYNAQANKQPIGSIIAELYSKYGMFVILVFIFAVASLLSNSFLSFSNFSNVLRSMAAVGLVAFGMTFILILGMIDLSAGSVMAFAGCVSSVLAAKTGLLIPSIIVGVVVGGIFGILNGAIVTKFGIPAFIMTLATQNIARGLALLITGNRPVRGMGEGFRFLGQGHFFNTIPVPIVIMIVFLLICWFVLNRTRFGRYVFAVGGNVQAAKASGISVKATVVKAYLLHGLLVGLAGVVLMSRMNSGQPSGAVGYEFDAITAVVLGGTSLMGGTGNMFGTFIGACIVAILDNLLVLKGIETHWQLVIRGVVIAFAVIADFKTKSILRQSN